GVSESDMLAILASKSRDNSRTPMQWDNTANAGFSQGKPWIEVANNYPKINVKAALDDPNSIFYCYQTLIKLRKTYPIFIFGDYQDLTPDVANCWCYVRHWNNQTLLVIANLTENTVKWQLPKALENSSWKKLLSNYSNQTVLEGEMVLQPYEATYLLHETD
ncbi:alpha-glucosidase C-terminal domain-containing protein, partial [Gilliamella sp. B2969]|uniref:alpha-amylase family glycosyl hydrolase n=1 Tax=Gilliamella sp. B2969 TaxID=2818021 RepID=UPI002B40F92B